MNRFCRFLAGLVALAFAQTLLATDLQVDLSYFNLSKATNRTVYGYLQTVPNVSGSSVVIGQRVIYTSDSSGIFYVSNCVAPGLYRFDVQAPPLASSFLVYISATNLGLISASSNLAVSGSATYPPGAVAWSASTSDSRFVKTPTNSATASDGQVISKTGNDTKWVTGGGAGSQTPWGQNINGAGYSLSNVLNLRATNITSRFFTNSGDARIDGDTIIVGTATLGLANIGAAATVDEDGDAYFPTLSAGGGSLTNYQTVQATNVNATRITSSTITNASGGSFGGDVYFSSKITAGLADIGLATIDEDGDSYFPTIAGDGSGVTNVPSKFVASINVLTNLPVQSNLIVYVESYFGTNTWGGGQFIWENSSATFDGGTVFVGTSGRWRRINTGYPTNVFFMEWFGVVPNAAINSYTAAQAAINATPTTAGATILPPYNFAVGTTLTYTNRRGSYFGPLSVLKTRTPGYRTYPNPVSVIHWMGVSGGTNLVAYDVGHCTFAGFGLDTRIGLNNGAEYTNAAGLLMDVDMNSTHSTTTSANVFDGMYFRERGTNTSLVGLRMASYNWENCEFFQFYDCYFQGSGAGYADYWINVTNNGGNKAIQLGGNGGGGNSFGHMMQRCGFNGWQYFIYSAGGSWDIENNYGTAAGVAAYYLNGEKASYLRGVEDEGDRQFVIAPNVNGVVLTANRIAQVTTLSVSNIAAIDGVNLTLDENKWNTDASGSTPSVTNSFNSTGRYAGRNNTFASTGNDARSISSWKFNSAFSSIGDFGTSKDFNNIQSGPWKTPSLLQESNFVYQSILDSATYPVMTLMPSNGAVAIGGWIANVAASIWNVFPDSKVSFQVGDQYKTDRLKLLASSTGNISELMVKGLTKSYIENYTTNSRVDLIADNARGTLAFQTGYGEITVGGTQVGKFDVDYKIKFPYDTNFEVVGPIYANTLRATNHITWFTNNSFSSLSSTPARYGQVSVVNSNGVLWQVTATTSGALAWSTTNQLGSGGGGSQTPWTSDINGAGYSLNSALGVRVTSGGLGTAVGGGDLYLYSQGYRVGRIPVDGTTIPSFVFGPDSDSLGFSSGGNAIIGGSSNTNNGDYQSIILGGASNKIGPGSGQIVLGGANNVASGNYNAVLGGAGNIVSNESFAIGQSAYATNRAAVVIAAQDSITPVTINSLSNETIYLYAPNGVTINTNNGTTNALFVFGSQTVSSNLSVGGNITGNGSGITNLQFAPTAITLNGTNAAMLSNTVSTLIVSTNVLFTNWPAMAVAGYWGRTILTNSQPNNELIYVPTNMMPHNLTNSVGCYVVLDNTGTNWACTLTNLRTAELVWSAWGGNVNCMHAYFRHW